MVLILISVGLIVLVSTIAIFVDRSNRIAKKAYIDNRADKLIPTNAEPERARPATIKRVQADSLAPTSSSAKPDKSSKDYDDFFDVDDDFFKQYDDDPFAKN